MLIVLGFLKTNSQGPFYIDLPRNPSLFNDFTCCYMLTFFITLAFAFGFFIESVIGFGGGLVAFSILGFFVDIKSLILIAIYIGSASSMFIIASDYKSFNKQIFWQAFPYCLLGTILGVLIFVNVSAPFLLKLFGGFLIILSMKSFFFDKIKMREFLVRKILVIGGFCHGIFGIGGPFFVSALKDKFPKKAQTRVTMAALFLSFNLVRYLQLTFNGNFDYGLFYQFWWAPILLIFAIHQGHKVHIKISEQAFKNGIAILTLVAGIKFTLS